MKQKIQCANCGILLVEGESVEGKTTSTCPVRNDTYEISADGKVSMNEDAK